MPITPDKTGGAGIGNLIAENRTPTTKPARVARITSFISFTLLSIDIYIIDICRRTVVAHRAQTVCISKKILFNVCADLPIANAMCLVV